MSVQPVFFPFQGGLDLISPAMAANPGSMAECLNFEVDVGGGYRRIDGYERFDGKSPPHTGGTGWEDVDYTEPPSYEDEPVPFDPVAEGPLGGYAELRIPLYGRPLAQTEILSNGFAILCHDANIATYFGGYFATIEGLTHEIEYKVAEVESAWYDAETDELVIRSTVPLLWSVTPRLELLQWTARYYVGDSVDDRREAIQAPPGVGPVWGTFFFHGTCITARNGEDGKSYIYRSTPSGWEGVPIPSERLGDAFYHGVVFNFTANPADEALYLADGKNKALEIKGFAYPEIMTAADIPTTVTRGALEFFPQRLAAHSNHLFMSFEGGWLQYSGIGDPFSSSVDEGAGGIGYGAEITNIRPLKDDALAVTLMDDIKILYGSSHADWQQSGLPVVGDSVGAYPNGMEAAGMTILLDKGGLHAMEATSAYGNFATGALSTPIQPMIANLAPSIMAIVPLRDRGQFRLYFQTGEFITMTVVGGQPAGFGYGKLPFRISSVAHGEFDGKERTFIGAEDGWVYEADVGASFDGEPIEAALRLHYHNAGNHRQNKRWRKAVLELKTPVQFPMKCHAVFNYGGAEQSAPDQQQMVGITGAAGIWNVDEWESFYWLGRDVSEGEMSILGHGRSISLMFHCEGADIEPFILEGCSLHYSPRRLVR